MLVSRSEKKFLMFISSFSILGFVGMVIFLYLIYKGQSAKSWPQADAVVRRSELKVTRDSDGSTYDAEVEYQYSVGSKVFSSLRISVLDTKSSNEGYHKNIVGTHPVGLKFKVFYNPNDPSYAIIHPGVNFGLGLFTVLTTIVFIVCFGITCNTVIGMVKAEAKNHESIKVDPAINTMALFDQFPDPPIHLGIKLNRQPDLWQRLFKFIQGLYHPAAHSSENNFLNLTGNVMNRNNRTIKLKGCLTYLLYLWGSAIAWGGIIMSIGSDVPIKINGQDSGKFTGIAFMFGFWVLWILVIRLMSGSRKGIWELKLDDRQLLNEINDGKFDYTRVFELNKVKSLQVEEDGKLLIDRIEESCETLFYPGAISRDCAQWIADSINQFVINRQAKP